MRAGDQGFEYENANMGGHPASAVRLSSGASGFGMAFPAIGPRLLRTKLGWPKASRRVRSDGLTGQQGWITVFVRFLRTNTAQEGLGQGSQAEGLVSLERGGMRLASLQIAKRRGSPEAA